jgi:hypothetical protein
MMSANVPKVSPPAIKTSSSKFMIWQSPESKWPVKAMPTKVANMSIISMPVWAMPTRTIRPGKEHTRLVVADITTYLSIWHPMNLSNTKVPGMSCSGKEEASREIDIMMATLPSRGRGITNPSSISSR